jgi:hypothetical protein
MVASALYVILAGYRTDAHIRPAQIAGQQSKAGQSFHDIDSLAVVGDPHAVKMVSARASRMRPT